MLTRDQAEGVATALLSPAHARGQFPCPACGINSISARDRRRLGLLDFMNCPACGEALRLMWGRGLLVVDLAVISAYGVWLLVGLHAGHVAAPSGAVAFVSIIVVTSIHRRLPLVRA